MTYDMAQPQPQPTLIDMLTVLLSSPAIMGRGLFETPYGLVVEVRRHEPIQVYLNDIPDATAIADLDLDLVVNAIYGSPGGRRASDRGGPLYTWADWGTNFMRYTDRRPWNFEISEEPVGPEELGANSLAWCAARDNWVRKYRDTWVQQYDGDRRWDKKGLPAFAHPREAQACLLEGMLLACWLTLQDHVCAVWYVPVGGEHMYVLDKDGIADKLGRFLNEIIEIGV